DTTSAIELLEQSVARIPESRTLWAPQSDFAPQRMLLARLAQKKRDGARSQRWAQSFSRSWTMGDVLFVRRVAIPGDEVRACSD
ncbi:MAG: hypothetical protein ACREMQ_01060, partial [Longimicrobiales bacterium]